MSSEHHQTTLKSFQKPQHVMTDANKSERQRNQEGRYGTENRHQGRREK